MIAIPVIICALMPILKTSCPPIILEIIIATIIGIMIVPDSDALMPIIPCMKKGTKVIAANIPILIKNPIKFRKIKVLLLEDV